MARISNELTEFLENEENLKKVARVQDLEELLDTLVALNEDKMIKIYENAYLKERFPHLASSQFLKWLRNHHAKFDPK